MNRTEIEAKWNTLTARERDAWVATAVMGWRRVMRPGGGGGHIAWQDVEGRVVALESDCSMTTDTRDWFRPSSDISAAITILGVVDGELYIYRKNTESNFVVSFGHSTEVCSECGEDDFDVLAQGKGTLPEAICLAALIAKLADATEVSV